MISINNLSVQFSGDFLFDSVSFNINEMDRIGLVGKNGAGKTTLLRIIAGIFKPESGNVVIPNDFTLGYLPQEKIHTSAASVFNETLKAFDELKKIEQNIHNLTRELEQRSDYESEAYMNLVKRLNDYNDQFLYHGGSSQEVDTEKILLGLGFERSDFDRMMNEFSGGWQMRVELAKILLQKPNLILLDEPTNHLDIESIEWLENFLKYYKGAVVLVSHDRAFLDAITNRTVEIANSKIYDYKASYSEYVMMREERLEQQLSSYNNQQKQIAQIERFVERFRYKSSKARQVQSKIKLLDKIDRINIEQIESNAIHFKFPPAPHSGKVVLEAVEASKSYSDKRILQHLNFIIEKGAKVAFVGRNGEGKSTLVKMILEHIEFEGEIKKGYNVKIGYYAQNQTQLLDLNKTVFETIDDIAVGDVRKQVRSILGSFLFSGETIEKKVSVLSGGEKSRLALACLLLEPVNLLILDEPTNHLDMLSKDILKNALLEYDGTLIVVSHDRDFLQGLTDRIYEFKNKNIKEYKGDIYDFLEARQLQHLNDLNLSEKLSADTNNKTEAISENKLLWQQKKELDKQTRKIKRKIEDCESSIEKIESRMEELNQSMNNPEFYSENQNRDSIFTEYEALKKQYALQMQEWEKLHAEIETLENS